MNDIIRKITALEKTVSELEELILLHQEWIDYHNCTYFDGYDDDDD